MNRSTAALSFGSVALLGVATPTVAAAATLAEVPASEASLVWPQAPKFAVSADARSSVPSGIPRTGIVGVQSGSSMTCNFSRQHFKSTTSVPYVLSTITQGECIENSGYTNAWMEGRARSFKDQLPNPVINAVQFRSNAMLVATRGNWNCANAAQNCAGSFVVNEHAVELGLRAPYLPPFSGPAGPWNCFVNTSTSTVCTSSSSVQY